MIGTRGAKMKVFEIQDGFGIENLKMVERPDPSPGPHEVLLRMRAASLNFRDLMMVTGLYNPKQSLPLIPCSDGVAEVIEVGGGVTRVKVGDRVAGLFCQRWMGGTPTYDKLRSTLGSPLDGTLAELMVLGEEGVVHVPEHLSDEEAASLPCAGLTAWSALAVYGSVSAGDTVLVQGTGGVSIFGLQFAQLLGARVIVTSSSHEKLAKARDLGAWQVINYIDDESWGKTARELVGGVGVDHVLDVGGAGTFEQSLRAARIGGHISMLGVLSGATADLNVIPIFMKNLTVQGIVVGSRDSFDAMSRAIDVHEMRPMVDKVFPFADTPEAFRYMQGEAHFGKICVAFE
jgi:NADPH:quinone reductase-like Zn-dependent oxidoreductase